MRRLIDTNDIRVKPQYMQDVMGIAMIRCEDLSRILADVPTVEAIPKAEYEARLKADMATMLEELNSEIRKQYVWQVDQWDAGLNVGVGRCSNLVQHKIDALKEQTDET